MVPGPLGDRGERTNANGIADFRSMPVGTYRVRVEMTGFATVEVPDVDVSAGQRLKPHR
ncbi:MAG: carboxypeptidase-like regulatory domain-containing protein [Gemmatimonadota bacterium]